MYTVYCLHNIIYGYIYIYIGFGPLPVRVTTRIIIFVGNRYKPLFANKYLDLPKGEWMMFGVPMPKHHPG